MTLPLHIFEPRYREMINLCLHTRQPFGVALIQAGSEVGAPARPHLVGTYGAISRVERLPDGRMNIEVVGHERFRLLELHHDQAYLTGTVERFPLQAADEPAAAACARRLAPWISRYLKLLGDAADLNLDHQAMPARPAALAYLGAIILQVPLPEKQALLSCASARTMLEHEHLLYRREISLVRAMLAAPPAQQTADFSTN
jgi:Lon protease-like protein